MPFFLLMEAAELARHVGNNPDRRYNDAVESFALEGHKNVTTYLKGGENIDHAGRQAADVVYGEAVAKPVEALNNVSRFAKSALGVPGYEGEAERAVRMRLEEARKTAATIREQASKGIVANVEEAMELPGKLANKAREGLRKAGDAWENADERQRWGWAGRGMGYGALAIMPMPTGKSGAAPTQPLPKPAVAIVATSPKTLPNSATTNTACSTCSGFATNKFERRYNYPGKDPTEEYERMLSAKAADKKASKTQPRWTRADRLGAGSQNVAYRRGNEVVLRPKSEQWDGKQFVRMPAAAKEAQVSATHDAISFLRADPELAPVITPTRIDKPGQLTKPYVDGLDYNSLSPPARARADAEMDRLRGQVHNRLQREDAPRPDGFAIALDREADNFRFKQDGSIEAWLDPVSVRPTRSGAEISAPKPKGDVAGSAKSPGGEARAAPTYTTYISPEDWDRLHPKTGGKLYHDAEHSELVGRSHVDALRNLGETDPTVLEHARQTALVHDLHPNRTPGTPPTVEATLDALDRDFSGQSPLLSNGRSLTRDSFGWTQKRLDIGKAKIIRTKYPFDEAAQDAYENALQGLRKNHGMSDGELRQVMNEGAVLSQFSDQGSTYFNKPFPEALKSSQGLAAEIGPTMTVEKLAPHKFIDSLSNPAAFDADKAIAQRLGLEFEAPDIKKALTPEQLKQLADNRREYQKLLEPGDTPPPGTFWSTKDFEDSVGYPLDTSCSTCTGKTVDAPHPWGSLRPIGSGDQSFVRGNDEVVVKRMRLEQFVDETPSRKGIDYDHVPLALRGDQANRLVEVTNQVRATVGDVVPEMTSPRPGVLVQQRVDGLRMDELSPEARTRAEWERRKLIARAEVSVGQPPGGFVPAAKTPGYMVWIDPNRQNFRFNPDGSVKHWFDPVVARVTSQDALEGAIGKPFDLSWTNLPPPDRTGIKLGRTPTDAELARAHAAWGKSEPVDIAVIHRAPRWPGDAPDVELRAGKGLGAEDLDLKPGDTWSASKPNAEVIPLRPEPVIEGPARPAPIDVGKAKFDRRRPPPPPLRVVKTDPPKDE